MTEPDADFFARITPGENFAFDEGISVDDFERLLALARRGTEAQWRTMETAPRDGTPFLAWVPDEEYSYAITGYCMDDGYFVPVVGDSEMEPTHWQPLTPPREQG